MKTTGPRLTVPTQVDGRPADTLLISDGFFGYGVEIVAELERRGRRVVWSEDRPSQDVWTKSLIRIHPQLMARRASAYFADVAARIRGLPITQVLVIKGEAMSTATVRMFRRLLPKAEFTLYFWDSYRNMPHSSRDKVELFDRALSFDLWDTATDRRLTYRPLFYLDRFSHLQRATPEVDFLFLGSAHTDRYAVLKALEKELPEGTTSKWILFYPSRKLMTLRRWIDPNVWGASLDAFVFKPLEREEVDAQIARARVCVDIERTVQSGFTIRTIEMLGARRKLLTTNPNVLGADFYRPTNIAALDRARPRVDVSFLTSPYEELPFDLRYRYSLSGWLDDVLPSTTVSAQFRRAPAVLGRLVDGSP